MSVSNNDFVTGENEGESLQTTEDSSTLAQSRVSTENESIVYALPKTYNGKTVTDLFPEFEHNKVLRFSRLLGFGRVTSLPKIWKGTRKRKKSKLSESANETTKVDSNLPNTNFNLLQAIPEESHATALTSIDETNEKDVFKLFDEEFSGKKAETQNKIEIIEKNVEKEVVSNIEENKINEELLIEEELEYETDDEIEFLKPFYISISKSGPNDRLSPNSVNNNSSSLKSFTKSTWINGPASFWYEYDDKYAVIASKKLESMKLKEKKKKHSDDEEDDEEDEDAIKRTEKDMNKEDTTVSSNPTEYETIDLAKTVEQLKEKIKEESFLLVNSTNWEENIIFDFNTTSLNETNSISQHKLSLSTHHNNGNQINNELINERIKNAGWIPSAEHRTLSSFQSKILGKKVDYLNNYKDQAVPNLGANSSATTAKGSSGNSLPVPNNWSSIFPNQNYDLLHGNWENKIIIDTENLDVSKINPPDFCLDLNDDNLLLGLPDDANNTLEDLRNKDDTNSVSDQLGSKKGDKGKTQENNRNSTKTAKGLLGKNSLQGREENFNQNEENNNENNEASSNQTNEIKSFWNISNDDYYNPKVIADTQTTSKHVSTSLVLQHTQASLELHHTFFPTHLTSQKLRNFHRYALKRILNSALNIEANFISVNSLLKQKFQVQTQQPLINEFISVRTSPSDLSSTDNCEIVLAEYSEQYPPLMMQTGMASKIRNYYKRRFAKDDGPQKNLIQYGEFVYINNSPFLGSLKPGDFLQSLENYMFRAPIYSHKVADHDFLVVRTRNLNYLIRSDIKNIFVVGQECPLIEVPGPNSKRANSFIKDFLQVFIYRQFHRSREVPKRIKLEDVKKAFPTHTESSIRKRLKAMADLRRTGKAIECNWWVLKDDYRLPSEEEIRGMITPEQCCAFYSMLSAEQRLKDAGYGEKNLFASDDDDVDNIKIDDEVKNAPWHTTRAYLDATKGKCLLQINGVADPTGRGEGFSYVRQPFKPNKQDEEEKDSKLTGSTSTITSTATNVPKTADSIQTNLNEPVSSPQPASSTATSKRTVTGTDADLRRLHLSQAKELLLKYGVPDHEIKKLKRWEIIDVVRTMSTQKAKEGNGSAVSKFARGSNRFTQSDAHEKFKEECQRLFDLQNRNLASEELLSTDDDEELDEDSDVDEMGKNLESMLQNKISDNASSNAVTANSAEKSIPKNDKSSELKNLIMNNTPGDGKMNSKMKSDQPPADSNLNRILKITRTYRDETTGEEYTKVEIVKKQLIIDAYVKIRTTRDDEFIRTAFALDEIEKEELRKERRKIQEQLRKFKRNEAKRDNKNDDNSPNDGTKPVVHKVRKYNKTGLNRKPKVPKSAKFIDGGTSLPTNENANSMISSPEISNLKKLGTKSSTLHYSSGDDESKVHGEESQSNQNDSIVSSLNNTLNGAPVVKKRKYQKRKKPDAPITDPISKVEGTKLIIQKKAIKLALANASGISDLQKNNPEDLEKMKSQQEQNNNYDSSISMDSTSPVKKKYRISKKQLKLQESESNSLMVVNSVDDSDKTGAPKLKITKKQNSSIILTIPKDKLALSSSSEALGNNSVGATKINQPAEKIGSSATSGTSSPVVDNNFQNEAFQQQTTQGNPQKRQYNKQSSLLKKQQKLLAQSQQQLLQQQLSQQISQASSFDTVSQLANLFTSQQQNLLLAALQIQQQNQLQSPLPANPFQQQQNQNPFSSMFPQMQQQVQPNTQQQQIKRKNSTQNAQLDYLIKPHKKVDRRHADPSVSFGLLLENILNELRELPEAQQFLYPVNSKKVPDYYNLVKNPIDLQTIRKRINDKFYKNRLMFLEDIQLLIDNSALYNGRNHAITISGETLYEFCMQRFNEKSEKFERLEKAINPLLDDNSLIAFNYLLDQIYEQNIIKVENSFSFLKPVSRIKYKDYYDIIQNPIDLETIKYKITNKKYKSREEFISDFELLYNNCLTYNGLNNSYTNTAQKLLTACQRACQVDFDNQMSHLEEEINNKMLISLDDEHSQSGIFSGSSHVGKNNSTADYLVDGESNLATSNQNDSENLDDIQINNFSSNPQSSRYSSTSLLPPKKIKSSNKNNFSNNNSDKNLAKSSFQSNGSTLNDGTGVNVIKKKKQNPLFSSVIKFNKNSPKSSSDAETYVDVESIDDKVGFHSLIRQNNLKYTINNKTIQEVEEVVCIEDNEADNQEETYEFNENQYEENY